MGNASGQTGEAMKVAVATGLKGENIPLEWATLADGILYTAQIPMRPDGSIETGDIAAQTALTLANLKQTVEAAGGTMADVTQVLIYLPDPDDFAGMNAVYRDWFPQPFPNRATVVAKLMVPGARIEIVAYAHIPQPKTRRGRPSVKRTGAGEVKTTKVSKPKTRRVEKTKRTPKKTTAAKRGASRGRR
jgi:2-iminobutanoate/2-iminopropanoate deaminase